MLALLPFSTFSPDEVSNVQPSVSQSGKASAAVIAEVGMMPTTGRATMINAKKAAKDREISLRVLSFMK